MIGNLEPEERVMSSGDWLGKLAATIEELGWDFTDEIVVKIAGTRTSGIHQTEDANPKWAPPYGDVRHNRDAQIVIENVSRRDTTKSNPLSGLELQQNFHIGSSGELHKTQQLETLSEPPAVADAGADAGA